jgi:hypothetical protein
MKRWVCSKILTGHKMWCFLLRVKHYKVPLIIINLGTLIISKSYQSSTSHYKKRGRPIIVSEPEPQMPCYGISIQVSF